MSIFWVESENNSVWSLSHKLLNPIYTYINSIDIKFISIHLVYRYIYVPM